MPALDILNLTQNEGSDVSSPLSLLFSGMKLTPPFLDWLLTLDGFRRFAKCCEDSSSAPRFIHCPMRSGDQWQRFRHCCKKRHHSPHRHLMSHRSSFRGDLTHLVLSLHHPRHLRYWWCLWENSEQAGNCAAIKFVGCRTRDSPVGFGKADVTSSANILQHS